MRIEPPTTIYANGFDKLRRLDLLKRIATDFDSLDENLNRHVARSFYEMRALDYERLEIIDDYHKNTCHYKGTLNRNFASAFLYHETSNRGLGIGWVARSSTTDYDMPWRGKNLLAGDEEKFRLSLFAAECGADQEIASYYFEGPNKYTPEGKWCCSELPLLNALDCIADGLGMISGPEDRCNDSCFVMMTERITCASCRSNIVKFLQNNHIKKLRLYYMFDSVTENNFENISTLLSFFHGQNIDAVIARVKLIRGADRDLYEKTPHAIRYNKPFTGFIQSDPKVYASMVIQCQNNGLPSESAPQYEFDPNQSNAYLLELDPDLDPMLQATDFFMNEFPPNHKYNLFNNPDKRSKK